VALREVWKHEAQDFTQWLQNNIDVLNDFGHPSSHYQLSEVFAAASFWNRSCSLLEQRQFPTSRARGFRLANGTWQITYLVDVDARGLKCMSALSVPDRVVLRVHMPCFVKAAK
jgi:hypothetical protein